MSWKESMPWAPHEVKKQNLSQDLVSELHGPPLLPSASTQRQLLKQSLCPDVK